MGNWFNRTMSKVGKMKLEVNFCCSKKHKLRLIPDHPMLKYFVIQNNFETKSWKRNDGNVAKANSMKR